MFAPARVAGSMWTAEHVEVEAGVGGIAEWCVGQAKPVRLGAEASGGCFVLAAACGPAGRVVVVGMAERSEQHYPLTARHVVTNPARAREDRVVEMGREEESDGHEGWGRDPPLHQAYRTLLEARMLGARL